jgi:Skp family chaperone for outer membrane proteins
MKKIFLLLVILNFFLINNSFANNIVFIDLNYIINNSITGKNVINKLEDINNKNLNLLKKEQLLLNKERDDIEKTKNILSQEDLNKKILILNQKLQEFNNKQDLMSGEFKNLRQLEMKNLLDKINPIIEKYMLDNNIDLMLKKENIYISKKDFDVSKKLIELINKNISN